MTVGKSVSAHHPFTGDSIKGWCVYRIVSITPKIIMAQRINRNQDNIIFFTIFFIVTTSQERA